MSDKRVPLSPSRKRSARAVRKAGTLHVAQVLKAHRERCQFSLEALSECVAITVSRLKKFEAAETSPYFPDEFFRLAYAFGIRPETLVRQLLLKIAPKKPGKVAQS